MQKIVRSICHFSKTPDQLYAQLINKIEQKLITNNFMIQTKRLCSPVDNFNQLFQTYQDNKLLYSLGTVDFEFAKNNLSDFLNAEHSTNFNIELSKVEILNEHVDLLFEIIRQNAAKTFNFTYVFNNSPASPFFPSAAYKEDGFSIGLQPTDLSENCTDLTQWFENMKSVWDEIVTLFAGENDFLGIDSSVAPLFESHSSLIYFIKRLGYNFSESVLTDIWTQITEFVKSHNPKPIGLNGLMLPALEDFELAREYEQGNFSIERNIFLSLHSGLGIDTQPIGVDQDREKVINILKLIQALSNKYSKPLSVRFVSDGKARVGEKTNFNNQYLYDTVVRGL